jgi:hypothetical protein
MRSPVRSIRHGAGARVKDGSPKGGDTRSLSGYGLRSLVNPKTDIFMP